MKQMICPSDSVISFSTAFSRSPVLGPREDGPDVERHQALALQALGHVAGDDALRQPLHDGGLADARLADEHGVVLGAAAQDLDDAADLVVAPDDGVELAGLGELGQVARVLFQGAVARLRLWVGDALPAADVLHGVVDALLGDAGLRQDARHSGVALGEDGEEDVLGGNVLVLEPVGFFVGQVNNALDARGDEDLSCPAAVDGGLGRRAQHVVQAPLNHRLLDAELLQDLRDHSLRLFQQRQQDVLGVHLVVPVALQNLISPCGRVLRALGETIKTHHSL